MTAPHLDPATIELGREALVEMTSISNALLYASLLTDDGFEIVHVPEQPAGGAVDAAVDGNRFASMASSIQALSEAVARELRIGSSEYVIIASARGHVIQLRVAGHPIVLGALFDDGEMLGKALTVARRCAQSLSTALTERAAADAAAAAAEAATQAAAAQAAAAQAAAAPSAPAAPAAYPDAGHYDAPRYDSMQPTPAQHVAAPAAQPAGF